MTPPPGPTALRAAGIGSTDPPGGAAPPALAARRWKHALTALAVAASALAVWVTATADFLAQPGWLAAQKTDFILGPVLVGFYWLRVRPASRFGWMLDRLRARGRGLHHAVLERALVVHNRELGELIIYLATEALILAFPTGRLEGRVAKLIMLVAVIGVTVPTALSFLVLPQLGAEFSLSGCRAACPENMLAVTSDPSVAVDAAYSYRAVILAIVPATIGLLVWRMVSGTPPGGAPSRSARRSRSCSCCCG